MTIVYCDYKPSRARRKKPEQAFPIGRIVTARPPRKRHHGELRSVPDAAQRTKLIRQFIGAHASTTE